MSLPRQLHAIVTGRVQGVYFRGSTLERARSLDLSGWVRNLPDGTVEVCAEGPRNQLRSLLSFLESGPPGAQVEAVNTRWRAATGSPLPFEIRG